MNRYNPAMHRLTGGFSESSSSHRRSTSSLSGSRHQSFAVELDDNPDEIEVEREVLTASSSSLARSLPDSTDRLRWMGSVHGSGSDRSLNPPSRCLSNHKAISACPPNNTSVVSPPQPPRSVRLKTPPTRRRIRTPPTRVPSFYDDDYFDSVAVVIPEDEPLPQYTSSSRTERFSAPMRIVSSSSSGDEILPYEDDNCTPAMLGGLPMALRRGPPSQRLLHSSYNSLTPTSAPSSSYAPATLPPPKWYRPLVEIHPGYSVPLCGSEETWHSYCNNAVVRVDCAVCQTCLYCVESASLVLCPTCKLISPVSENKTNNVTGTRTESLGLGLSKEHAAEELETRQQRELLRYCQQTLA